MKRETKVLKADEESIAYGAKLLRQGKLVVFPTETVYGIGANALDTQAAKSIFTAKGRPADNPLIVHISDISQITPLVSDFPEKARKLAKEFWPGPLTMILPKSESIPEVVSPGLSTVAIRLPSHPVALALLEQSGIPVVAPSANRSGSPSPTTAEHVLSDLNGRVDLILDGGDCNVGVESTVISLANEIPMLLRPGAITPEMITEVIGEISVNHAVLQEVDANQKVMSPGMKYKHYAPKAEVHLVHGTTEEFVKFCNKQNEPNIWAMGFTEDLKEIKIPAIGYGKIDNEKEQAAELFKVLRELDSQGAKKVYVHAPSTTGLGLAIYNRLLRAAAFRRIYL